jgi:predicted dienelactone hydrolase
MMGIEEIHMLRPVIIGSIAVSILLATPAMSTAAPSAALCLKISGKTAAKCLKKYVAAVDKCRKKQDTACEDALRAEDGVLDELLATPESKILGACSEEFALTLGYTSLDDISLRVSEACADFAEDLLDIGYADALETLPPNALTCQARVAKNLNPVRKKVVGEFGHKCYLKNFAGKECKRDKRDEQAEKKRLLAHDKILTHCGNEFDTLELSVLDPNAPREERVDEVLERVIDRARHFAQLVYPPNDLGPTTEFGPYPIGVQTLDLLDPNRTSVADPNLPRPVKVEVYYPSTDTAVEGVPQEVVQLFGFDIVTIPAYRDVERAPGSYPLVLFSHGNNGLRFQSFFFAGHLASHGFVVVSPDHHGNTFIDDLAGVVDPNSAVNRPLDMSFLIDQFLAFNLEPGDFFEGSIDPNRIGASGHSFGGYTVFALAGGAFGLGTLTDSRIQAIFPQAPSVSAFPDAFFSTITIPTLIVGGSIDETTPFPSQQQRPFDLLPSGADVVAVAELIGAGHFTFSDFCEVPRELLGFLGGFEEACEPRHLPWRHAHDIVNYLSLSFFDGVLNGNADALERVESGNLATIEDLVYQSK